MPDHLKSGVPEADICPDTEDAKLLADFRRQLPQILRDGITLSGMGGLDDQYEKAEGIDPETGGLISDFKAPDELEDWLLTEPNELTVMAENMLAELKGYEAHLDKHGSSNRGWLDKMMPFIFYAWFLQFVVGSLAEPKPIHLKSDTNFSFHNSDNSPGYGKIENPKSEKSKPPYYRRNYSYKDLWKRLQLQASSMKLPKYKELAGALLYWKGKDQEKKVHELLSVMRLQGMDFFAVAKDGSELKRLDALHENQQGVTVVKNDDALLKNLIASLPQGSEHVKNLQKFISNTKGYIVFLPQPYSGEKKVNGWYSKGVIVMKSMKGVNDDRVYIPTLYHEASHADVYHSGSKMRKIDNEGQAFSLECGMVDWMLALNLKNDALKQSLKADKANCASRIENYKFLKNKSGMSDVYPPVQIGPEIFIRDVNTEWRKKYAQGAMPADPGDHMRSKRLVDSAKYAEYYLNIPKNKRYKVLVDEIRKAYKANDQQRVNYLWDLLLVAFPDFSSLDKNAFIAGDHHSKNGPNLTGLPEHKKPIYFFNDLPAVDRQKALNILEADLGMKGRVIQFFDEKWTGGKPRANLRDALIQVKGANQKFKRQIQVTGKSGKKEFIKVVILESGEVFDLDDLKKRFEKKFKTDVNRYKSFSVDLFQFEPLETLEFDNNLGHWIKKLSESSESKKVTELDYKRRSLKVDGINTESFLSIFQAQLPKKAENSKEPQKPKATKEYIETLSKLYNALSVLRGYVRNKQAGNQRKLMKYPLEIRQMQTQQIRNLMLAMLDPKVFPKLGDVPFILRKVVQIFVDTNYDFKADDPVSGPSNTISILRTIGLGSAAYTKKIGLMNDGNNDSQKEYYISGDRLRYVIAMLQGFNYIFVKTSVEHKHHGHPVNYLAIQQVLTLLEDFISGFGFMDEDSSQYITEFSNIEGVMNYLRRFTHFSQGVRPDNTKRIIFEVSAADQEQHYLALFKRVIDTFNNFQYIKKGGLSESKLEQQFRGIHQIPPIIPRGENVDQEQICSKLGADQLRSAVSNQIRCLLTK